MEELKKYTTDQIMKELKRRRYEKVKSYRIGLIDRLKEDVNYIKNVEVKGAPGRGNYSVEFEVWK